MLEETYTHKEEREGRKGRIKKEGKGERKKRTDRQTMVNKKTP